MRTQPAISHKVVYSFESEDFEQWQLGSLQAVDDVVEDEYESLFEEESLADNVVEFLGEVGRE